MTDRGEALSMAQRSADLGSSSGWSDAPPAVLDRVAGRLPSAADALDTVETSPYPSRARPLSLAQEVQWSLDHTSEGLQVHIIPRAYRLRGSLDGDALARALNVLVHRHEALRTTFAPVNGSLAQRVAARGMAFLRRTDLARPPGTDRDGVLRRLLQREARRSFDLQRGPLLRGLLVRVDSEEHVLLLATPAIVADEWSMRLLWRELGEAYSAEAAGQPVTLSPPAHRLISFADREFQPVRPQERGRLRAYWENVARDAPGRLDLPRRAPIGERGGRRDSVASEIDAALVQRLRHVARERRVSLFMLLTAAYAALLNRYTGQQCALIAAPIVHRRRPELEWMVGCYTAMMPLRVEVAGVRGFGELLERVRESALSAYEHAGLPAFPADGLSTHALAETSIALDDAREERPAFGRITAEHFPLQPAARSFGISLRFEARGHALASTADYRADIFAPSTIRRLLEHHARILEAIARDPDRPLAGLGAVDAAERRLLLSMGRGRVLVEDRCETVWSLFGDQVRRTPSAIAVQCDGVEATYAATLAEAQRVAGALRRRGIGEGARVGVVMSPSVDIVPAALGVMAAGAACVPIPRSNDREATARLAADSALAGVIVDRVDRPEALAFRDLDASVLAMSEVRARSDDGPLPLDGPAALDAAWVAYTVDEAGRLRGTVIEHQALVSRFRWQAATFRVGVGDCVMQFPDEGQPPASLPLFPLITGGCLTIVPDEVTLSQALRWDRAAYVCMSPSAVELVLGRGGGDLWRARSLRGLICVGEAPAAGLERAFRRLAVQEGRGDLRLHLVYSRPETSGAATHREVPPLDRGVAGVSLGRPIANVRVYVVDERGALCPVGARGEIWIGGRPVARGYHERTDLTALRFFRDPFASGGQVVRTGDVGRWRPDGQLEYLGPARA